MFNVQPPSGRVCCEMGSQIATNWTLQAILTSAATCHELLVSTARVRVPRGSGLFYFFQFLICEEQKRHIRRWVETD